MIQQAALVCGAGGFIGHHLVSRLKADGYRVVGVDLKEPEFGRTAADEFLICDLRDPTSWDDLGHQPYVEMYQLAADMGGAGYVFTGEHDAEVMHNSAAINLNAVRFAADQRVGRVFFASSACIYPEHNQLDPENPNCEESSAYPANPDSEYGWEKLFSERLYLAFGRNRNLQVRIARLHNVFGPLGTWRGGREKAPAAICRKVAEAPDDGEVEVWGDGSQTRTFLYVEECIEGIRRLMQSDLTGPVNIGSDEMVSINELVRLVCEIADKQLKIRHTEGPLGVRGRKSDNRLIRQVLGWSPTAPLRDGLAETYRWVAHEVKRASSSLG